MEGAGFPWMAAMRWVQEERKAAKRITTSAHVGITS